MGRTSAANAPVRRFASTASSDGLMDPPVPTVRPALRRDLRASAAIHERWLPTGFFPRLGRRFLRTYHASFVASPHAVALVADHAGGTAGFLVGTLDNDRHYRWVARHRALPLGVRGLVSLLSDGALLRRFLRTRAARYARGLVRRFLRRPVTVSARSEPADRRGGRSGPIAVLTHVAVAPAARRCGAGAALVRAFEQQARTAGAAEIRLISPTGSGAPAFYRSLGWRSSGVRQARDGTQVEEFSLTL